MKVTRNKRGGDDNKKQSDRVQHQKASTRERSWRLDRGDGEEQGENWAEKERMIQTAALKVEAGDDTGQKRQCKVLMTGKEWKKERQRIRQKKEMKDIRVIETLQ